jgi:hypothetical protein
MGVLPAVATSYEIILVNDCSGNRSWEIINYTFAKLVRHAFDMMTGFSAGLYNSPVWSVLPAHYLASVFLFMPLADIFSKAVSPDFRFSPQSLPSFLERNFLPWE